ncbi:MAG: ABC transporter permease [Streptosporangiaceae bacterium]
MMWLTWRQFRAQAIAAAAALAALTAVLVVTGLHLTYLYAASGVSACQAHGDCGTLASDFISQVKSTSDELLFYAGIVVMYAAPAIIGVFWGAPLITRELEAGTFRLAWNQSVTRARWIAVKLGLTGLAARATAGLLSLLITWWAAPLFRAAELATSSSVSISRLEPPLFGAGGIAPVGYAAFAFALGVTAGLLIRRTIPAMAITLAAFAAIQVVMPQWVRPHLIAPLQKTVPLSVTSIQELEVGRNGSMLLIGHPPGIPGAWILSNQTITPAGHVFTGPATQACQTGSFQACNAWLAGKHLRELISYQPASRYWAFQWYETAIFIALALALAGFCYWRVRRLS